MKPGLDGKIRCFGNKPGQEFYARYHDEEWGKPEHDDQKLFEILCLEGAQAGLNWETILKKREGYRRAFHNFDLDRVLAMSDAELDNLREDPGIVRNRLKIYSVRKNAIAFKAIQQEFGSFSTYLWAYVDNKPVQGTRSFSDGALATSPISDALSKDLKRRGMSFVGSTIIYAYLQAAGLINDHFTECWCHDRTPA